MLECCAERGCERLAVAGEGGPVLLPLSLEHRPVTVAGLVGRGLAEGFDAALGQVEVAGVGASAEFGVDEGGCVGWAGVYVPVGEFTGSVLPGVSGVDEGA